MCATTAAIVSRDEPFGRLGRLPSERVSSNFLRSTPGESGATSTNGFSLTRSRSLLHHRRLHRDQSVFCRALFSGGASCRWDYAGFIPRSVSFSVQVSATVGHGSDDPDALRATTIEIIERTFRLAGTMGLIFRPVFAANGTQSFLAIQS